MAFFSELKAFLSILIFIELNRYAVAPIRTSPVILNIF